MRNITVLTGGVGGAKLVAGLCALEPALNVTAIVNTGDDFHHLGLAISPDIDTLLYVLSGQDNRAQGWGREGESWSFMAALRSLGGPDWFALGDGDLALHVMRTARLAAGATLSTIIADFARAWGISARILPMSDGPVATMIETDQGSLGFQDYFVARRCTPVATAVRFEGASAAGAAPEVVDAIASADAILIAPSNPYLSIDPILAVPAIRAALAMRKIPVVAVSPIVGGEAVKGPTAKLMREFGVPVSARTVADHYGAILDGMLIDRSDADETPGIAHAIEDTLMHDLADKQRVAAAALALVERLR